MAWGYVVIPDRLIRTGDSGERKGLGIVFSALKCGVKAWEHTRFSAPKCRVKAFFLALFIMLLLSCGQENQTEKLLASTECGDLRVSEFESALDSFSFNFERKDLFDDLIRFYPAEEVLVKVLSLADCRSTVDKSWEPLPYDKDNFLLLYWKHLLQKDLRVTPQQVASYYREHLSDFTRQESILTRHLFLSFVSSRFPDVGEKIREIHNLLKEGEPFGDLIQEYSQSISVQQGGYLGRHGKGELIKEFEDVAFGLETGEIAPPLLTEQGYHIIQLCEKYPSYTESLGDVSDEIRTLLSEGQFSEKLDEIQKNVWLQVPVKNWIDVWNPNWPSTEILWQVGDKTYHISDFLKENPSLETSTNLVKMQSEIRKVLEMGFNDALILEAARLDRVSESREWKIEWKFYRDRFWFDLFGRKKFRERVESDESLRHEMRKYFEKNRESFVLPPLVDMLRIRIEYLRLSSGRISPGLEEMIEIINEMRFGEVGEVLKAHDINRWFSQEVRESLDHLSPDEQRVLLSAAATGALVQSEEKKTVLGPFSSAEGWILLLVNSFSTPSDLDFETALTRLEGSYWKPLTGKIIMGILNEELKKVSFQMEFLDKSENSIF